MKKGIFVRNMIEFKISNLQLKNYSVWSGAVAFVFRIRYDIGRNENVRRPRHGTLSAMFN